MTDTNCKQVEHFDLEQIQDVINYIEENLLKQITLKSIASQFYLSESLLNRSFKMVCGFTVIEYVRNRRLCLAGQDLIHSNISIIDLALRYGYETPESFTKAFVRFYGFPPSFVRRTYPPMKRFNRIRVRIHTEGGFDDYQGEQKPLNSTYLQDTSENIEKIYEDSSDRKSVQGGIIMEKGACNFHIQLSSMKYRNKWKIILCLIRELKVAGITFKIDEEASIFVHGLEFDLEEICLVFRWIDEQKVRNFFKEHSESRELYTGYKYFYTIYQEINVQCVFYMEFAGYDTEEQLFKNTDFIQIEGELIRAQSLQFYYENAKSDSIYYKEVERWLNNRYKEV